MDRERLKEWVELNRREALKMASKISRKQMRKDIEECEKQVKLKILARVNRIMYPDDSKKEG